MELLKLQRLHAFVVLAQSGSLTDAARRLSVSQQALSKTLAQLEAELSRPLIVRKPWSLTPAGCTLLAEVLPLLERTLALEDRVSLAETLHLAGTIRLAAQGWLDPTLLDAVKALMQQHPQLSLQVQLGLTLEEMEQGLLAQTLDLALFACKPRSRSLKSRLYGSSPLVVVARERPSTTDWREWPFLAVRGYEPLGSLLSWPAGFAPEVVTESDLQTAIALALDGHGALLAPESAVRRPLDAGQLAIVARAPFKRVIQLWLVWSRTHADAPLMQTLFETLIGP
ncbi:MAG: LysR family transcriptional regulator [Candidatus Sericytochromatia bacterium]